MKIFVGLTVLPALCDHQDHYGEQKYEGILVFLVYKQGKKIFVEEFTERSGECPSGAKDARWVYRKSAEVPSIPEGLMYIPVEGKQLVLKEEDNGYRGTDFFLKHGKNPPVRIFFYSEEGYDEYYPMGSNDVFYKNFPGLLQQTKEVKGIPIHFREWAARSGSLEEIRKGPPLVLAAQLVNLENFSYKKALKLYRNPFFPITFDGLVGPYDREVVEKLRAGHETMTMREKFALWWISTPGSAAEEYSQEYIPLGALKRLWEYSDRDDHSLSYLLKELDPSFQQGLTFQIDEIQSLDDFENEYISRHNEEMYDARYCYREVAGLTYYQLLAEIFNRAAEDFGYLLDV